MTKESEALGAGLSRSASWTQPHPLSGPELPHLYFSKDL